MRKGAEDGMRECSMAIIAAGERWEDGTLRPSWEDMAGAGATISHISGSRSPEAQAACRVFQFAKGDLEHPMLMRSSGRQRAEGGFHDDVKSASEYSMSTTIPFLNGNEFADQAVT